MDRTLHDMIGAFAGQTKGARRRVAVFLLEHFGDAAFMTVESLAAAAQVSTGTVSKVTREMGFSSFAAMQKAIRYVAFRHITPEDRLNEARNREQDFALSLQQDIHNLQDILQHNSRGNFEEAASLLAHAPAVHAIGLRSSYTGAFFLSLGLSQLRDNVHCVQSAFVRGSEHVPLLRRDDVVVLISFPRYLRESVLLAGEAQRCGCRTIAITDSSFSPIARNAAVTLVASYESGSFFNSNVAALSIVNLLLTQVAALLQEKGKASLQVHNAVLQRWNTFIDSNGL